MAEQIGRQEESLNKDWPVPLAHFLDELRLLSVGLYPQELIERLRTEGYQPIIVGFEHGPLINPPNVMREQTVRALATGIRREVHGFQVLAEERPDIIAVGYTHAFKYGLFFDPEQKRSFYFFNFDPDTVDWKEYMQLFREAYALYREEMPLRGSTNLGVENG